MTIFANSAVVQRRRSQGSTGDCSEEDKLNRSPHGESSTNRGEFREVNGNLRQQKEGGVAETSRSQAATGWIWNHNQPLQTVTLGWEPNLISIRLFPLEIATNGNGGRHQLDGRCTNVVERCDWGPWSTMGRIREKWWDYIVEVSSTILGGGDVRGVTCKFHYVGRDL